MDQESKDANSLLVELDRGLKSPNLGDQCEAVVRFTNLFQRYPLPILINSACLKLAEAFRCGSNFIRVQICEVLERNQSHLNKIYNVDDFYRNIFTVSTSNDPIARSLTLLALGNIAPIISEHKSIHHCISSSFESTVECELIATIACAARFVKQSSEFACNIYPKIVSIVDSDKSSTEVRIRALSVLDHGFYSTEDVRIIITFLENVIKEAKEQKLICTCLTLSTKIAHTSLIYTNMQIWKLINTFQRSPSRRVKLCALKNLKFLAEKSPHIWTSKDVKFFVSESIAKDEILEDDQFLCIIISIFCKLLSCKCNCIQDSSETNIFQFCYKLALNNTNIPLCSMAFELLTIMSEEHSYSANNMIEYQSSDLTTHIYTAIKTFLTKATTQTKSSRKDLKQSNIQQVNSETHSPKTIYRHIVKLCQLNPHFCPELLEMILKKISTRDTSLEELSPYVTELMCAILQLSSESIPDNPDTYWKLIKAKSSEMSETNLLNLCVLYFQVARQVSNYNISNSLVDKVTQDHDLWFGYKVMRQAMRFGHFEIAKLICNQLHDNVTTDTIDFYFVSLSRICAAELLLSQRTNLDANLKASLPLYEESISPLRASIGNSRLTDFQIKFLWLRVRTLKAHYTLRHCCKIYEVSPISYRTLLDACKINGNDLGLTNCCSISQQMSKIAKEFQDISSSYENLSMVTFNCDNRTLDYLNLLKYSCTIMADAINSIFQYGNSNIINNIIKKLTSSDSSTTTTALEHKDLEETCIKLIELIHSEVITPGIQPSDDIIEPMIELLKTFSTELLECSFVYPRYFFQPLQMTQIKLAITPQPNAASGTVSLLLNNNFVLKVEGLIQNLSKRRVVIREISKVLISVSMSLTKSNEANYNISLQSTAEPQNNYFTTEFLLPLKWAGSFNVDIEVSIIDEQERIWKSGPIERLNLTVS